MLKHKNALKAVGGMHYARAAESCSARAPAIGRLKVATIGAKRELCNLAGLAIGVSGRARSQANATVKRSLTPHPQR